MIKNGRAYTLKSENGLGDECDQVTSGATMGGIDTAGFMSLVFGWIHDHIAPASRTYTRSTSYGFKHMVENEIGYYITNNQFKDAMLLCGYQPVKPNETNWMFKIKVSLPSDSEWELEKKMGTGVAKRVEDWAESVKGGVPRDAFGLRDYPSYKWYKSANEDVLVVKSNGETLRIPLGGGRKEVNTICH